MPNGEDLGGFILIYRKIQENPIWRYPAYVHLWLYLLLNANWKDRETIDGVKVPRGSLLTGRAKLAQDCNSTEQSIRTALSRLESTSMITMKSTSRGTIVSVTNYDKYQAIIPMNQPTEQPPNQPVSNQPSTSGQPAANQQVTTREQGNKETREQGNTTEHPLPPQGDVLVLAAPEPKPKRHPKAEKPELPPYSDEFLEFYNLYPKATTKAQAFEFYLGHVRNGQHAQIMAGLRAALPDLMKSEKRYRLDPVRWLSNRRWEDCQHPPVLDVGGVSPDHGVKPKLEFHVAAPRLANVEIPKFEIPKADKA